MLLRTIAFASGALLCAALNASPSYAVVYVATNGSGSGCTRTAPCAFINDAVTAADIGDTIVCLSPPSPSDVSINKSITIDCPGTRVQVRGASAVDGSSSNVAIVINIPVSTNDPNRTVRLRGLTIDGNSAVDRPHAIDRGISIVAAAVVYIEDCVVSNLNQQGIYDHRTGGQTKLFVKDTIVSSNGGPGIVAASASPNVTALDNVTSENNAYGIAVGTGNNVVIKNSTFSGNSVVGVEGDAGSHVVVRNSTISHNNISVQSVSSVRIFNNDISFNNTAFSGSAGTMGLNMYSSNGSPGTTPMPIPNAPADIGP